MWLIYSFQIRAYVLPNEEFENVEQSELENCSNTYAILFEQLYGMSNSAYSIHMMCHLKEIRLQGKFTDTSTFKYENYYGEMRRSFVSGTASSGKQILQAAYFKRSLPHKNCRRKLKYSEKETFRSSDKFVYIYVNKCYKFYMIKKNISNGSLLCVKYGKRPYKPTEVSLNWSTVGVFLKSGESDIEEILWPSQISGKAIIVNNLIISCPKNVLQE